MRGSPRYRTEWTEKHVRLPEVRHTVMRMMIAVSTNIIFQPERMNLGGTAAIQLAPNRGGLFGVTPIGMDWHG
ncbi:hypothetical protein FY534_00550 [Alicyclobacillus sp. TC]|uniref:hypothetical protein n=1 Tax=Alicyclobacillus TaxID=29330 RepID=UPI000932186C|nr:MULTISPECIES: hypothetical protein [Alicyclobacillus]QRF22336.1 hypothetical protein FY534_00550 [Alicyclobacillus sp. TC]